ncbi:MAG: glutaminyl-peptide cyclotransferase [Acidobacteriota bacterium]
MAIYVRVPALALSLLLAGLPMAAADRGESKAKTLAAKVSDPKSKSTPTKPEVPNAGIKTPGIQIPYASLKADAEIPGAPAWILPSDTLLVPAESGSGLQRIDLKTNKRSEPMAGVDKPCSGALIAFKSLWVTNCADGSVVRMDAKGTKVEATLNIGVANLRSGIASTSDSVWVLTDTKTTLSRIDPESNSVVAEIRVGAGCFGLQSAESSLWLTCPSEDKLLRINPMTNLVEQQIKVTAKPSSFTFGDGSLWVLGLKEGKIDRIDPKTNKVIKTISLEVADAEGSIVYGEGALWASLTGFPLMRIDTTAEKETVLQQFAGENGGSQLFAAGGSIWLSNTKQANFVRLDPKRIVATLAE